MERDAWRNAMIGLCQIWAKTPDQARTHLKARLARKPGSLEHDQSSINGQQPVDEYHRGLLDAAKVCEAVHEKHWDAYKRSPPDDPSRGNPHVEGMADGASQCEEAIRALASLPTQSARTESAPPAVGEDPQKSMEQ
ncbi:hypothetical protein [Ralstonia sp. ASV6]|uniref:hypothetical protein n=1 Tax=Ralstonia sp. ASV6 TaxID=2795124 RepID=UPI0018ED0C7C|nr:hypothetical protein [Ralstonia sp. ASV6]